MFSFRTTPLLEQEDTTLRRGRIAVLDDETAWHPQTGEYLGYTLARYRNVVRLKSLDWEDAAVRNTLSRCDGVVIEHQGTGNRFDPFLKQLRAFFLEQNRAENPLSIYLIDRLNPSGRCVEGCHYDGLPHKHGLTMGEIANMYYSEMNAKFPLHIISAAANDAANEIMPWSIPQECGFGSLFSADFISGATLWQGTNVSCGIGTIRPYEMFGAPFMARLERGQGESLGASQAGLLSLMGGDDEARFVRGRDFVWDNALTWNDIDSPVYDKGVYMRWCRFTPRYGLYAGQECCGFQMIPNPGEPSYNCLLHTLRLIRFVKETCQEFEFNSRIDSLAGSDTAMQYLRGEIDYAALCEFIKGEEQKWLRKAKKYLLYDEPLYRVK